MSRGPGKIERAIGNAFKAEPEREFRINDLVLIAYPGVNRIEKKHKIAAARAAKNACRWTDFEWWGAFTNAVRWRHRDNPLYSAKQVEEHRALLAAAMAGAFR